MHQTFNILIQFPFIKNYSWKVKSILKKDSTLRRNYLQWFSLFLYSLALQCKPIFKSNTWALSIVLVVGEQIQYCFQTAQIYSIFLQVTYPALWTALTLPGSCGNPATALLFLPSTLGSAKGPVSKYIIGTCWWRKVFPFKRWNLKYTLRRQLYMYCFT